MKTHVNTIPSWIVSFFRDHAIAHWGIADLKGFTTPADQSGHCFRFALSWAIPMDPVVMGSIVKGKDADLVIWSDNPLSIYAKVEKTIIDGKVYYDVEEDQQLRKNNAEVAKESYCPTFFTYD